MKSRAKRLISIVLVMVMLVAIGIPQTTENAYALTYNGSSSYKSGKYYTALKKVKLTGNQRTDIVNVAKSQIGYQEGSSSYQLSGTKRGGKNYTEYGRWYGLQDMWCAMFVSWCSNVAGVSTSIVPKHCFTPSGLSWFKSRGKAYSRSSVAAGKYKPKAGDIIYFKSSRNKNSTNHIGIVTGYSGKTIYTIEGNTSSATISTNGGAVAAKSYSISNTYIVYVCSPAYKGTNISTSTSTNTTTSSTAADDTAKKELAAMSAVNLGDNFYAKINYPNGGLNLSLSDTNVITYGNSEKPAQVWNFIRQSNGSYKIVNTKTGQCLDVSGGSSKKGTNVDIHNSNDTNAQRWYIYSTTGGYLLKPACASSCVLDVADGSTKSLANIQIYTYNKSKAQVFKINKVSNPNSKPEAVDLGADFYAKIKYPKAGLNLSLLDKNVITYKNSEKPAQVWRFVRQSNGSYKIVNTKTNECLAVKDSKTASGSAVVIAKDNGGTNQRWFIYNATGGYKFVPANSTACSLDVTGAATAAETKLQIYTSNSSAAQVFNVTKVEKTAEKKAEVDLGADFYAKINYPSGSLNLSLLYKNVITYKNSDKPAQIWHFVRQSNGSYKIVNTKTNECLAVKDAKTASGSKVVIAADNGKSNQRWNVYAVSGGYTLKPANSTGCALDVTDGSKKAEAKLQIYKYNASSAQVFKITKVSKPAANTSTSTGTGSSASTSTSTSKANMEVIRKIIYAVETGGQVYGKADYTDFTEAYTNSSAEHAITIGAGQWYGVEAKTLLNNIRKADPAAFKKLDTAGIAKDLDTKNWSKYKLSRTSAKAKCIKKIIGSSVGRKCQDALIEEQMAKYMKEAKALGVTAIDAQMMCANIRHQGGTGALKRVLKKTKKPYTLDNIYNAMKTDTGNQVGAYKSRQKMVYNALKKYL